jgi:hypothetical protein
MNGKPQDTNEKKNGKGEKVQTKKDATKKPAEERSWISEMHESFFWSGVVTFLMIFCFDIGFVSKSLGSYLLLAKAINTGACWFCFMAGSRKTLQMFSRFLKVFNSIKKGEESETTESETTESETEYPEA